MADWGRGVQIAGVALLVAAVATVSGYVVTRDPVPAGGPSVVPASTDESTPTAAPTIRATRGRSRPLVVIIGDSYSEGFGASSPSQGYAQELARRLGWDVQVFDSHGGGWLIEGQSGRIDSLAYEVADQLPKLAPDVVIVQAGHNDVGRENAPEDVELAAENAILALRLADMSVPIVVLGVFWPEPMVKQVGEINEAVLSAAAAITDTTRLNPLADGWGRGFPTTDGTHPTDAGYDLIASKIISGLRAAGLIA